MPRDGPKTNTGNQALGRSPYWRFAVIIPPSPRYEVKRAERLGQLIWLVGRHVSGADERGDAALSRGFCTGAGNNSRGFSPGQEPRCIGPGRGRRAGGAAQNSRERGVPRGAGLSLEHARAKLFRRHFVA